jgi:hypothetical protein
MDVVALSTCTLERMMLWGCFVGTRQEGESGKLAKTISQRLSISHGGRQGITLVRVEVYKNAKIACRFSVRNENRQGKLDIQSFKHE